MTTLSSRRSWVSTTILCVVLSAGCDFFSSPGRNATAELRIVTGDGQVAAVGSQLPVPLAVVALDADGHALAGQQVTFVVTAGGGSMGAGAGTTNESGMASDQWTLGTTAGESQRAEARVLDEDGEPVVVATFTATAMAGPAASLLKIAGDGQIGAPGDRLPDSLAVRLTDGYGNVLAGHTVQWSASSGSITPAQVATDANGVARASWVLGSSAGSYSATASRNGVAPATFSAGTSFNGITLTKVSGDAQSGPVNAQLPVALVVVLRNAGNVGIAGAWVRWFVAPGNGTATPDSSLTDGAGQAEVRWTMPATSGPMTLTADVAGQAAVTFTALAQSGTAASIALVSGDAQTAEVGAPLAAPLVVVVRDAAGNPAVGDSVTWTVTAGGGTFAAARTATDVNGEARATWTLGLEANVAHGASASIGTLPAVSFTATATLPATLLMTKSAGDNQAGTVGTTLPDSLEVALRLADGRAVKGVRVTWSASHGGTVAAGATSTSDAGRVRARWTLGLTNGEQRAVARWHNAQNAPVDSVTFTAAAQAGSSSSITISGGNGQTGDVGAQLAESLAVTVRDALGNPVSGTVVNWNVSGGGGTVSALSTVTNASGIARVAWTLGLKADVTHTATAAMSGVTPVQFTAAPRLPASLVFVKSGGDAQTATAGTALADSLEVTARLSDGRAVEGVRVTWAASHGGQVAPRAARTAADGRLRARWTLGVTQGAQTVVARWLNSQDAVVDSVTFTGTATAPPGSR